VGLAGRGGARADQAVAALGGVALLAGSWVIAATGEVPDWEARTFEAVNGLPGALWPVVWVPMQIGSYVGSLLVVGAVAVGVRDTRPVLATLTASQLAFWSAKGVKRFVKRGRPDALIPDVRLRERATGHGYVSGHAAVAFALATALVPVLAGHRRALAWPAALVVAFGRVYGGVHLPLDAVGGAGLGVTCGSLSRRVVPARR
jgi:undecaprenyl-diphosphatase